MADKNPANDDNIPFDKELKKTRRRALNAKEIAAARARGRLGNMGFWTVVAGVGFAVDWTFLGGFGTAIAALSSVGWASSRSEEHKAKKEVADIDEKLMDLEELRTQTPAPQPSLKQDFDKSGAVELERKIERMRQELEELKNPKPVGLDKPKPGAPRL